jgi:hypothetical protein
MMKTIALSVLALSALTLGAATSLASPPAPAEEVENGTLAAAIRDSGQPCARVIEKEHQGGSLWVVRCNSGRFQVRLNDDSTAEVVLLD